MGYMKHEVVVAVFGLEITADRATDAIVAWRDAIADERLRKLVAGPVSTAANGYTSWAFMPDGSKEGWDLSDQCDSLREEFKAIVSRFGGQGVHVAFGGDYRAECADGLVQWQDQEY